MLITLSHYTNPLEAYIIQGRLAAESINSVILFEQHIWANWTSSLALGGVRLMVPVCELEQARSVLAEIAAGQYEAGLALELPTSKQRCPRCGSDNNAPHVWLNKLALVCALLAALIIPYTNHLYSCDDCFYSWIAHEQRAYPLYVLAIFILLGMCFFGLAALCVENCIFTEML
jgi:hypothetical protein